MERKLLGFMKKNKALCIAIIMVAIAGISFLITSGLFWVVCKCFSITFTWKYALGVWVILFMINGITVKLKKE